MFLVMTSVFSSTRAKSRAYGLPSSFPGFKCHFKRVEILQDSPAPKQARGNRKVPYERVRVEILYDSQDPTKGQVVLAVSCTTTRWFVGRCGGSVYSVGDW